MVCYRCEGESHATKHCGAGADFQGLTRVWVACVCVRVYVMLCGIGLRGACLAVPLWWWWESKIVCV